MVVRPGLAFVALLLASVTGGCRSPCGGVSGACMVITLDSAEPIDALELKLRVKDPIDGSERDVQPGGGALQRVGQTDRIRLLPPLGVDSAQITAISLLARRETGECFQYSHFVPDWPSGTTQSLTATFRAPPRITALSPLQGPTSGGTPVDLQGENFVDGMRILWGNASPVSAQLQNVRSARIQSQPVPAWTPGTPTKVAVRDPAGCQTTEATQGFQQYAATVAVDASDIKFADHTPVDIATGYINKDEHLDIALLSLNTLSGPSEPKGYATFLFGSANGVYSTNPETSCRVAIASTPQGIAVGRYTFGGKSQQDIAILSKPRSELLAIIPSDDTIAVNCNTIPKQTVSFLSDSASKSGDWFHLLSADVNSDNIDDLFASSNGQNTMNGLVSNTATYQMVEYSTSGTQLRRMSVGNYDSPTAKNIILSDFGAHALEVLKVQSAAVPGNPGSLTYSLSKSVTVKPPALNESAYPFAAILRLNPFSGDKEIVFSRSFLPSVVAIPCAGTCNTNPTTYIPLNSIQDTNIRNVYLAYADMNGDSLPDLIMAGGTISDDKGMPTSQSIVSIILTDSKTGNFSASPQQIHNFLDCLIVNITVADINHDAKPDLILAGSGPSCANGAVMILKNSSQ